MDVELELNRGKLVLRSVASTKSDGGAVLREANVFGCTIANPKKSRKGQPYSFRLNLESEDSKGDQKYILSMGCADLQAKWTEYLLAYSHLVEPEPMPQDTFGYFTMKVEAGEEEKVSLRAWCSSAGTS